MKYRTILADPPWPVRGDAITRPWVMGPGGRRKRGTVQPYPLMTMAEISALPVAALAEDDAHLYLWTTMKLNARGIGVATVEAWGFRWVGEIIWMKNNFGLGAFPRPQHEILVVARRGSLPFRRRDVGSVQAWRQDYSQHSGKRHSVKPEHCCDLIETTSPGPYLEMFARRQRLGWHSWGNEALCHVEMSEGRREQVPGLIGRDGASRSSSTGSDAEIVEIPHRFDLRWGTRRQTEP